MPLLDSRTLESTVIKTAVDNALADLPISESRVCGLGRDMRRSPPHAINLQAARYERSTDSGIGQTQIPGIVSYQRFHSWAHACGSKT